MKVALLSDLHIEHHPLGTFKLNDVLTPEAQAQADVLILAGDIGDPEEPSYSEFLAECSRCIKSTIVIAGNHEYYTGDITMAEVDALIEGICSQLGNVAYLNNQEVTLGSVTFIGSTLWSHVPKEHEAEVGSSLNDYNYIFSAPRQRLTVSATNDLFRRNLSYLEAAIARTKAAGKTAFVVTHHTPAMDECNAPEHRGGTLKYAFSNDCIPALQRHTGCVAAWVSGHTHHNFDFVVGSTRVLSNQYGYKHGRPIDGFCPDLLIPV